MQRLFFELRYLRGHPPWDTGITPPEVMAFIARTSPGRALDLGCGTGTNCLTLARHGWRVLGVDFSARAVRRARRRVSAEGLPVEIRRHDVTDLHDLQEPFDLILDIGCFHALPPAKQDRYAAQVTRLARPGGTYLLYTFLDPDPARRDGLPTEATLRLRFEPAFRVASLVHGTDRQRLSAWFTFVRSAG